MRDTTWVAAFMVLVALVAMSASLACCLPRRPQLGAVPGMLACGPAGRAQPHLPPRLAGQEPVSELHSDQPIELRVVLGHRDPEGLERHLRCMADPAHPLFGVPMSHQEFVDRHLPDAGQLAAARAHFEAHGLEVAAEHAGHLRVVGTAGQLGRATDTQLVLHRAGATPHHATDTPPRLPEGLGVAAVVGAQSRPQARSYAARAAQVRDRAPLDANALRRAYGVPDGELGAGARMAVLQLGGYDPADLAAYCAKMGVREVPRSHVRLHGYDGAPRDRGAQTEVTLDLELMNAMAPGAEELRVYQADQRHNPHAFYDLLAEIVNPTQGDRRRFDHISCSWGTPERGMSADDVAAEALLFRQLAATGRTFYAASGDEGAYDGGDRTLQTDDPASQPYVAAVGGTSLTVSDTGDWMAETTWRGGGGGVSCWWAAPAWQGAALAAAARGGVAGRDVPDLALHADPQVGHAVYIQGRWQAVGGTSCAAPAVAALGALVDAARRARGMAPLGFLPPRLYALAQGDAYGRIFHDIHDGSTNGYYPALVGADEATGLGSPRADGWLQLLAR